MNKKINLPYDSSKRRNNKQSGKNRMVRRRPRVDETCRTMVYRTDSK